MAPFQAQPLRLQARLVERVWGGHRLSEAVDTPIGELWAIDEQNVVASGPYAGQSLGELAHAHPQELLGHAATQTRFPLLIKLLDCADWLSVQVHPDDDQAARLEGAGTLGKTEAWHILATEPSAQLIAGVHETTTAAELGAAIRSGRIMDHAAYSAVKPGDSLMIPAGTVHALGPGILLYEVQQSSDVTYRIYDWDRPLAAGRTLHLEQSAAVACPGLATVQPLPCPALSPVQELLRCDYFVLEHIFSSPDTLIHHDTAGHSFHALTVTSGEAELQFGDQRQRVQIYDSVLLPASLGKYTLRGHFEALISRLP